MGRLIGIAIAAAATLSIAFYFYISSGPTIPDSSVLVLEVGGVLPDAPAVDTLDQLLADGIALPTLVLQLDKAAADARISAVLLQVRPLAAGFAQLQELRQAIERTRASDTRVIALLELASLNATRELYLASAADQVYVTPGFLGPLTGVAGSFLLLGGVMEKLGVLVEYESVGEYKSAPEMFASSEMSSFARENANDLLDGIFSQIVAGIAEGRDLEPERVRQLIDSAPSTGPEYVEAELADGISDRSEVLALAGFEDAEEVSLETYWQVDPRKLGIRNGPAVALVFGHGTIVPGEGGRSAGFAADRIARALDAAAQDGEVRAIVLRVDSGGGSAIASDQLWRAIERARADKPVVISMGNAAASGGYYLASAADAIVAQPSTLTGSIGVFVLRPSFAGLYEKLDIHAEVIARGAYATLAGNTRPFTEAERVRTRAFVRAIYDDFVHRVATGRDMLHERVDELGRGRVWLGSEALDRGLVDELGGLHTAVERAKLLAGIDPEVDAQRHIFPGPRSIGEQVRDLMRGQLPALLWRQAIPIRVPELLQALTLPELGEIVLLPPFWLELD